jgi:hypothetical protein
VKNFKVVFTALVVLLAFVFIPYTYAKIGVGVGTGKIVVTQDLKPGQIYVFPSVAVLNTGDEDAIYRVQIAYHEAQPELMPPKEWFTFEPNDFELKPDGVKNVDIRVNIPLKAVPGDYFAYIEATPLKKSVNGVTAVSIAAASKLYFKVVPASFIQGVYYRAISIWQLYEPWSTRVAFSLGLVVVVLILKKYLNIEINLKSASKKKDKSKNDEKKNE